MSRGGPLPAAIRRAVLLRDHCRCRVPGCNRRRYVDVHHIVERAHGGEHSRSNCLVLCTTHHRLLHEGKLAVSGDAEGELSFCDAEGATMAKSTTQGGSREPQHEIETTALAPTERLLHVMGRSGGWTVDKLIDASGLAASDVNAALTFLELGGQIRHGRFGFEPSRAAERPQSYFSATPNSAG